MNALEQDLEARTPGRANEGEKPGEVVVRVANAAYLQRGYPFRQAYLDTIGHHYGPVLNAVDFEPDPDAVAHEINRFVAGATAERIKDLLADGVLKPETVLALVNALYLKASWLQVFPPKATSQAPFHRRSGGDVEVPMMQGTSDGSGRGDGWVAATKAYVGGLAAQFILPDEGRFDEVAADIPRVIAQFDEHHGGGALVGVPRFTTRVSTDLSPPFKALGLGTLYENGNLLGVADDPKLVLDVALHQAYVAMDEEGTEAAAATVLVGIATSAPVTPPVPVVLDRPFLFRIFDQTSGATLFLGRILDPTS
jgi:serpin B